MVDNYDSFTYNLVHYLEQLDFLDVGLEIELEVLVKRNDQITLSEIKKISPTHIVLSPGPCTPDKAGLCLDIMQAFYQTIPILGVCLGHQIIAQFFGARVIKASQVMHGKTSQIRHINEGLFLGLPQDFNATRYHSLMVAEESIPDCLKISAWTKEKAQQQLYIMGLKHNQLPIESVQFHPESILSEHGLAMLKQFFIQN